MKKMFIFTIILMLSLISCATTSQPTIEVFAESEPEIEFIESVVFDSLDLLESPEETEETEEMFILGAWSGSMILGSKDIRGNWAYHGFEYYHFFENKFDYVIRVENYGVVTSDYRHTYQWKYENGKYYKKLYKDRPSKWSEFDVLYTDENNIVIDNIKLKRVEIDGGN